MQCRSRVLVQPSSLPRLGSTPCLRHRLRQQAGDSSRADLPYTMQPHLARVRGAPARNSNASCATPSRAARVGYSLRAYASNSAAPRRERRAGARDHWWQVWSGTAHSMSGASDVTQRCEYLQIASKGLAIRDGQGCSGCACCVCCQCCQCCVWRIATASER